MGCSKSSSKREVYSDTSLPQETNTWGLNNTLLKNQWVNEENKEEIRKYLATNENKNTIFKIYRTQQKQS